MNERLVISLIGMSNVGKSYWSDLLEKEGFIRYGCDDIIESKLGPELKALRYSGIEDVARWMGQPFDPQYHENSRKYLDFEGDVVEEALDEIDRSKYSRIVIDTTGKEVLFIWTDLLLQGYLLALV